MYIDILGWSDYIRVHNIKHLPLNEQMKRYNYYLMEQQAVMSVTTAASAAGRGTSPTGLPSNCIEFVVNTTTGGTTFTLNITTSSPTNVDITWGDGNTEQDSVDGADTLTHTFPESNTEYTVRMCFDDVSVITALDFPGDD
jgi:hypothetical protein